MVFDLQDQLPSLATENSRKRTIALQIDPQHPNQISIHTSLSFESMNKEATAVTASLTAEQTILPFNERQPHRLNLERASLIKRLQTTSSID